MCLKSFIQEWKDPVSLLISSVLAFLTVSGHLRTGREIKENQRDRDTARRDREEARESARLEAELSRFEVQITALMNPINKESAPAEKLLKEVLEKGLPRERTIEIAKIVIMRSGADSKTAQQRINKWLQRSDLELS
jgi:hypothetical protein